MPSEFYCDMTALTPEQRARHQSLARQLRPAVRAFVELTDGYGARFDFDAATLLRLAEFIALERLCCPCFTLAVEAERAQGPLWLRITGSDGVKPFIRTELGMG